jgi:hypothetical protein
MQKYNTFFFEDYAFDFSKKKLLLFYSFDKKLKFTEEIVFDFDFHKNFNRTALEKAFEGIFIMCGISYFKVFLPKKIKFLHQDISPFQKKFFQKVYTQGLGEFFFKNQINPQEKINFSGSKKSTHSPESIPGLSGSIVPMGGGKDSLTTAEILKSHKEDFEIWTVGSYPFFQKMLQKIGHPHISVQRKIDPQLFDLNKKGALNGHIPISAILAFLSVASAILRNRKYIILSNESSANEENTEFFGMKINHQYSKTIEFEKDFREYVHRCISPDIEYFSFLRPLSELKIAEIFCKNFLKKYAYDFSSCNKNFRIQSKKNNWKWCGNCPKCAFVFLIFSPFTKRETLINIFGENLFLKKKLKKTFLELLGKEGYKPFECVGEIQEAKMAFQLAQKSGQWSELETWQIPSSDFNKEKLASHTLPDHFVSLLQGYCQNSL